MSPPEITAPRFLPILCNISNAFSFSSKLLSSKTCLTSSVSNLYLSINSFKLFFNKNFNKLNPTSIVSNTSSFIVPVYAKFNATFSSPNFGHNTPGVSSNSIPSSNLIHCFCLVTPGLFPTCAATFLDALLIKEDFPTFGIPSTITRMDFPILPLFLYCSFILLYTFFISAIAFFIPSPELQFTSTADFPSFWILLTHFSFSQLLDKSDLFNNITVDLFFIYSCMSGFWLDTGILASKISTTISISFKSSIICLLVFAICPGYQLMFVDGKLFVSSFIFLFFLISLFWYISIIITSILFYKFI